ncbi:hypothetical protein [Faecalicoccus pleomorphus]|uniref:hypothetical protein n=2 Tax=Faecalicoccus pleomorphus TaxID=1323 RepID=UPI00242DBD94|nr:hypothetical protein [Faecalicoccus pleomorphus]
MSSSTSKVSSSESISMAIEWCIRYGNNESEKTKELIKFFKDFGSDGNYCKAYEVISNKIYGLTTEDLNKVKVFIGADPKIKEPLSDAVFQDSALDDTEKSNLAKFQRHVKLSCFQKEYIDRLALDAKNSADSAEKMAKSVENRAKKAQKKVTSIYSEFIAILGIFTALSFALNGSFQILGTLFKDIKHPTTGSIGYALVIGGIYLLLVYGVILILFIGMSKVVDEEAHYRIDICFLGSIFAFSAIMIVIGMFVLGIF